MDPAVTLALRSAFALLLASSAAHKLRDPARFRAVLAAYDLLPAAAVVAAAPGLALAEAALAALLASGIATAVAAMATAGLMLLYAAALHANVRRGRTDLDCGCTGPASSLPVSPVLVARNVVLAAAALPMAMPVSGRPLGWPDLAGAAAAVAAWSACWLAAGRLLALAPRAARLRSRRGPS